MRYGMLFTPGPLGEFAENVRGAEALGFDFLGIADSQSLFREVYGSMAVVAQETSRVEFGPTVTNPVSRHPVVTASAMSTIDELSDGRAYLGVGTGDSALHTIGEPPATLSEMKTFLETFGSLTGGETIPYDGNEVRLKWVQEANREYGIPRYISAEGPKTLKLGGMVADGVLIGTGLFPELIRESIELVNEGAQEAGRDPESIDKIVFAKSNVREDRDAAVDEIKMALTASANHAFRFTLEGKMIPEEYKEPIRKLKERYVSHEHEQTGETTNRRLADELGLTAYLADRFAVVGTPDDCVGKLEEITSVEGVDGVLMTAITEDEGALATRMGTSVLPNLA